jgi:hypothetical protein
VELLPPTCFGTHVSSSGPLQKTWLPSKNHETN